MRIRTQQVPLSSLSSSNKIAEMSLQELASHPELHGEISARKHILPELSSSRSVTSEELTLLRKGFANDSQQLFKGAKQTFTGSEEEILDQLNDAIVAYENGELSNTGESRTIKQLLSAHYPIGAMEGFLSRVADGTKDVPGGLEGAMDTVAPGLQSFLQEMGWENIGFRSNYDEFRGTTDTEGKVRWDIRTELEDGSYSEWEAFHISTHPISAPTPTEKLLHDSQDKPANTQQMNKLLGKVDIPQAQEKNPQKSAQTSVKNLMFGLFTEI